MPHATPLDRKLSDGASARAWGVAKLARRADDGPPLTAEEKFGCSAPGFEAALDRALSRSARTPLRRYVETVDLSRIGPSVHELNSFFYAETYATRRRYAAARRTA